MTDQSNDQMEQYEKLAWDAFCSRFNRSSSDISPQEQRFYAEVPEPLRKKIKEQVINSFFDAHDHFKQEVESRPNPFWGHGIDSALAK